MCENPILSLCMREYPSPRSVCTCLLSNRGTVDTDHRDNRFRAKLLALKILDLHPQWYSWIQSCEHTVILSHTSQAIVVKDTVIITYYRYKYGTYRMIWNDIVVWGTGHGLKTRPYASSPCFIFHAQPNAAPKGSPFLSTIGAFTHHAQTDPVLVDWRRSKERQS